MLMGIGDALAAVLVPGDDSDGGCDKGCDEGCDEVELVGPL